MDPLTFANQLASKQETEPQLDRWAHKYLETSAVQMLHAARFIDPADKKTKDEYLKVLVTVLEGLPNESELEISRDLYETLASLSEGQTKELLEKRVRPAGSLVCR